MGDSGKTRAQLLQELDALRSRVVDFKLDPAAPAQLRPTPPTHDKPAPDETAELEHLYRTAPVGLCLMDTDLCFVRINERLAAINGRPVSEHLGRTLREVIPDIAPKVDAIYRQVIETGTPVLDYEVHGTTPANPEEERSWLVSYHPVTSPDGTVQGVSTAVQDVTEHKRAERALRESEQRFRQIAENVGEVFFLSDARDNRAIYLSPAYEEIWGRPVEEVYADPRAWQEAVHPEDSQRVSAVLEKHGRGQESFSNEYRIVRPDGAIRWVHDRVFPVRNEAGEV